MLPTRRTLNDLLGLGVELRPEQVALLAQPSGVALTMFALPDPAMLCCTEGCYHPLTDTDPVTGFQKPVFIPVVLHYSDIAVELDQGTMLTHDLLNQMSTDEDLKGWNLFPLLLGRLDIPLEHPVGWVYWDDAMLMGYDLSARRIWDVWPITEEQAAQFTFYSAQMLLSSDYEEMLDLLSQENDQGELDAAQTERMTMLLESGDLHPVLALPPELKAIWNTLLRVSEMSWDAIYHACLHPLPPDVTRYRPERMFSPWY